MKAEFGRTLQFFLQLKNDIILKEQIDWHFTRT